MKWKKGDKFIIERGGRTYWRDEDYTVYEVIEVKKLDKKHYDDDFGKPCVLFYYKAIREPYFAFIDCIRKPTKLELALA